MVNDQNGNTIHLHTHGNPSTDILQMLWGTGMPRTEYLSGIVFFICCKPDCMQNWLWLSSVSRQPGDVKPIVSTTLETSNSAIIDGFICWGCKQRFIFYLTLSKNWMIFHCLKQLIFIPPRFQFRKHARTKKWQDLKRMKTFESYKIE